MKKILLILAIISLGITAYSQNVMIYNGPPTETVDVAARASTVANAASIDSVDLGWFNVLNYGAIPNDGLEDTTGINAAIRAAQNYDGAYGDEATVYIPSGIYNNSGPIIMKDRVSVRAEDNTQIRLPSGYSGAGILFQDGENHSDFSWTGGSFRETSPEQLLWSGIKVEKITSDSYFMAYSIIRDVEFWYPNIGIELIANNGGWINENSFINIDLRRFVSGLKTNTGTSPTQIDGNRFINIGFQAGSSTKFGIDSLDCDDNIFFGGTFWDFTSGVSGYKTIVLASASARNTFVGFKELPKILNSDGLYNFDDFGTSNQFIGYDTYLNKFNGGMIIDNDASGRKDSVNKLTIINNGDGGSNGNPSGWSGIKFIPYKNGGDLKTYGYLYDATARIIVGNERASNYSSHLKIQMHETSQDNTEESMFDAMYIDGSESGDVTFNRKIKSSFDYNVSVRYCAKVTLTFDTEIADTICYLPAGSVVDDVLINVLTLFNDGGSDLIKVGYSPVGYDIVDNVDVSSTGWADVSAKATPIYQEDSKYIIANYNGSDNDASAGICDIYVYYTMH